MSAVARFDLAFVSLRFLSSREFFKGARLRMATEGVEEGGRRRWMVDKQEVKGRGGRKFSCSQNKKLMRNGEGVRGFECLSRAAIWRGSKKLRKNLLVSEIDRGF